MEDLLAVRNEISSRYYIHFKQNLKFYENPNVSQQESISGRKIVYYTK